MARRGFPPWFCCGCQKRNPVSVWIEGQNEDGKWCLPAIRRAHEAGRNNAPRHPEVHGPTPRF